MKNVLVVSTVGLIYDGITNVIMSYLEAMDRTGMNIYVAATIEAKETYVKKICQLGCTVVHLPNRRKDPVKYAYQLSKLIKEKRINVIHIHGNSATMAIELLAATIGGCKRRIVHSHNTKCDQVKLDKLLRPLFYVLYTDGVACGEQAGHWLFNKRKFTVLPNGRNVDLFRYKPEVRNKIREQFEIHESDLAIGHVGGFFEQKNHKYLVAIYREIKKIDPSVKLYMIGEGPLKNEIQKSCDDLEVTFTGAIDNVSEVLNAMDGMLLPSLFEGLPLVVIEWQINGLPCVISDKVTPDCKMTDGVYYMSIDDDSKKWAEIILKVAKENRREHQSRIACDEIKRAGFDIKESASILRRLYL